MRPVKYAAAATIVVCLIVAGWQWGWIAALFSGLGVAAAFLWAAADIAADGNAAGGSHRLPRQRPPGEG